MMRPPQQDLSGQTFGRLRVLNYLGPHRKSSWFCRCECGKTREARSYELINGISKSCGCLGIELRRSANIIHGHSTRKSKTREYKIYIGIIRRCTDGASDRSKDYAGRGIRMCDRWRHGEDGLTGYECFIADMGPRPSRLHSVDRIENDGNYEPSNCRWATKAQQARNRRSNRTLVYRGRLITMTEATLVADVSADAIRARIHKGWTTEAAIETPPAFRGGNITRKRAASLPRAVQGSIRGHVLRLWTPDCDPEDVVRAVTAEQVAGRHYIMKICRDLSERHALRAARTAIVVAISERGKS